MLKLLFGAAVLLACAVTASAEETDDLSDKVGANKVAMQAMLSTRICRTEIARRNVLDEIKKQRKYARIGGVQNNSILYSLQTKLRVADESIASDRKSLATWPAKALSCNDDMVKAIRMCAEDEAPPSECSNPSMALVVQWVMENDDQFNE